jgi:UDP-2,3-diacylglucosamine pyrophosphatase LpxH
VTGPNLNPPDTQRLRALFLSDVHLGSRACKADALLSFLRTHDAGTIYLVGDIVDLWRVRRKPYWPQSHNDVLQKLLRKARKGTRVVLVPGNHDDALRDLCPGQFGRIEFARTAVHETAVGQRLLVMHGDEFDPLVHNAQWLALAGDRANAYLQRLHEPLALARRQLGLEARATSPMRARVKSLLNVTREYEHKLASYAAAQGFDGVVCGHIHHAADRSVAGVRYLNCGDWVQGCTAIAETDAGDIRLLRWHETATVAEPGAGAARRAA